jgi:predicted GIY-YIG superfamily endonuclease
MASVYLLHFTTPLKHAQHYCGHTPNGVDDRLALHRAGNGARIVRALMLAGGDFNLARTWEYDTAHEARIHERRMKTTHHLDYYCPICKAKRGCRMRK